MPTNLTINNITGQTPYDIYICDSGATTCIYVSTITDMDIPYSFDIPNIFDSLSTFKMKIIDDNNCEIIELITT